MRRGRPPKPGTADEKAAARRERVRNNVRALRERRKKEAAGGRSSESTHLSANRLSDGEERSSSDDDDDFDHSLDSLAVSRKSSNASSSSTYSTLAKQNSIAVIDTKSLYSLALIGNMRANFLPDSVYLPPTVDTTKGKPWESDQFLWTPCAFWVTNAFTRASSQDTGLLKTAVLAVSQHFYRFCIRLAMCFS